MNPFSLAGKTIIITGASSGIGAQSAIDCSRMGAKVVAIARNKDRLESTLQQMQGDGHIAISYDLSNTEGIPDLISNIVDTVGKIDGLVHCAGASATLPLKQMSPERVYELFRQNLFSAIELTRQCATVSKMNAGGSIVFMASIMACVGDKAKSLYSMTKGAMVAGTRSLACELAKRRIRVNCISPGAILTPINKDLPHMSDPQLRAALEESHPLGLGEVQDISHGIVYLLSDAARWLTGQNLIIDGGYTAR